MRSIVWILACLSVALWVEPIGSARPYGSSMESAKSAPTVSTSVLTDAPAIPEGARKRHALDEFRYTEIVKNGVTYVYGTINNGMIWSRAQNPYVLMENTFVSKSGSLTIEPGTVVKVFRPQGIDVSKDEGVRLAVYGVITARGLPNLPIRFTAASDQPEKRKEWEGIHLNGSDKSQLEWIVLDYARFGIDCYTSCVVSRCVTRYCFAGLYLEGSFAGDVFNNVSAYNVNGVTLNGTDGGGVFNCIFYANENTGIQIINEPKSYLGYNLCYKGGGSKPRSDYELEPASPKEGDLKTDPKFVSPASGDFRLSPASPARQAGYEKTDMGLYPEGWSKEQAEQKGTSQQPE